MLAAILFAILPQAQTIRIERPPTTPFVVRAMVPRVAPPLRVPGCPSDSRQVLELRDGTRVSEVCALVPGGTTSVQVIAGADSGPSLVAERLAWIARPGRIVLRIDGQPFSLSNPLHFVRWHRYGRVQVTAEMHRALGPYGSAEWWLDIRADGGMSLQLLWHRASPGPDVRFTRATLTVAGGLWSPVVAPPACIPPYLVTPRADGATHVIPQQMGMAWWISIASPAQSRSDGLRGEVRDAVADDPIRETAVLSDATDCRDDIVSAVEQLTSPARLGTRPCGGTIADPVDEYTPIRMTPDPERVVVEFSLSGGLFIPRIVAPDGCRGRIAVGAGEDGPLFFGNADWRAASECDGALLAHGGLLVVRPGSSAGRLAACPGPGRGAGPVSPPLVPVALLGAAGATQAEAGAVAAGRAGAATAGIGVSGSARDERAEGHAVAGPDDSSDRLGLGRAGPERDDDAVLYADGSGDSDAPRAVAELRVGRGRDRGHGWVSLGAHGPQGAGSRPDGLDGDILRPGREPIRPTRSNRMDRHNQRSALALGPPETVGIANWSDGGYLPSGFPVAQDTPREPYAAKLAESRWRLQTLQPSPSWGAVPASPLWPASGVHASGEGGGDGRLPLDGVQWAASAGDPDALEFYRIDILRGLARARIRLEPDGRPLRLAGLPRTWAFDAEFIARYGEPGGRADAPWEYDRWPVSWAGAADPRAFADHDTASMVRRLRSCWVLTWLANDPLAERLTLEGATRAALTYASLAPPDAAFGGSQAGGAYAICALSMQAARALGDHQHDQWLAAFARHFREAQMLSGCLVARRGGYPGQLPPFDPDGDGVSNYLLQGGAEFAYLMLALYGEGELDLVRRAGACMEQLASDDDEPVEPGFYYYTATGDARTGQLYLWGSDWPPELHAQMGERDPVTGALNETYYTSWDFAYALAIACKTGAPQRFALLRRFTGTSDPAMARARILSWGTAAPSSHTSAPIENTWPLLEALR